MQHPDVIKRGIPADLVMYLSDAQRASAGLHGPDSVIWKTSDGVDMSLFEGYEERDPNRLIWTSNPDRGLNAAAMKFQRLRERLPDLELHVYGRAGVYGWAPAAEDPYMPLPEHSENIILHDPLPRPLLARELMKSKLWFYPTWWPETFCMAALEAQAAGTVCVCSPLAALNEVVKGGVCSYDIEDTAYDLLTNEDEWLRLSDTGRQWAAHYDWALVARRWQERFQSHLMERTTALPVSA
jgi:glycosyltransferase involved in cell wall biosynthesis